MRPRPWEISSNILRYNLSFVPLLFHLPTDWTCDPSFVWSRKRIEHYRTVLAEGHQVYVWEIMNRREEAMLNSTMCFAFMKLHLFTWFESWPLYVPQMFAAPTVVLTAHCIPPCRSGMLTASRYCASQWIGDKFITHMRTMVLKYLPSFTPFLWPSFVGKYTIYIYTYLYMEHIGCLATERPNDFGDHCWESDRSSDFSSDWYRWKSGTPWNNPVP